WSRLGAWSGRVKPLERRGDVFARTGHRCAHRPRDDRVDVGRLDGRVDDPRVVGAELLLKARLVEVRRLREERVLHELLLGRDVLEGVDMRGGKAHREVAGAISERGDLTGRV